MNILALRSYMNFMSKLILLIVLAFQIIAFNASNASADSKSALFGTASGVIADIAEKRITSIVNISSTKVIKTQQSQQNNPLFNDPFFQHFFGQGFFNIPRERREKSNTLETKSKKPALSSWNNCLKISPNIHFLKRITVL